mmetsp:Transcript_93968/g.261060  ORF Transcript_93968/g.261060 Transcript_93968/m.261060 type:complete len:245 (-) Transcript_93968:431-1165(-)
MVFAVVLFNVHAPFGEGLGFLVRNTRFESIRFLGLNGLGTCVRHTSRIDNGGLFAADPTSNDRIFGDINHGFEDLDLIGVYFPSHNTLPESIRAGNNDCITETGIRIQCKRNSRRSEIRAHHQLDDHGSFDHHVIKVVVYTVCNGSIRKNRRQALQHSIDDSIGADHIEKGSLLTRKGCCRQILRSGRASDGNAHVATILAHCCIGFNNIFADVVRESSVHDHLSGLTADIGQVIQIGDIHVFE